MTLPRRILGLVPFAAIFFHALAVYAVFSVPIPRPASAPPGLMRQFWSGNSPMIEPGSEFAQYEKLLPPRETVSFLMDFPFHPYGAIQPFYTAQSYLAPRLLTYEPKHRAAIIYGSNQALADKRLQETGYSLLIPVADGKGIAAKKAAP